MDKKTKTAAKAKVGFKDKLIASNEGRYYAARAEEAIGQSMHLLGEARTLMELAGFKPEVWNACQPMFHVMDDVRAKVRKVARADREGV